MKDLKAYLSRGSCSSGCWLDGERFVYISTDPDGRTLMSKNLKTGEEQRLFTTTEMIWNLHVNRETVFFTSDIGGTENEQIFALFKDADKPVNLTDDNTARHNLGALLPDGKTLVMASNARDKKTFDIAKIDIFTREKSIIKENDDNYNMPAALSPDGKYLLYNKLLGQSDNALWMVNVETGEAVKTPPIADKAAFTNPVWKSDSSGFFLITDYNSDFEYVAYYDIKQKSFTEVLKFDWDAANIALSSDDRYLAVCVNEGGYSVIYIYDLISKAFANTPTPPKGVSAVYGKFEWSHSGHKLLFPITSGKRPMDLWVLDMDGDSVLKVTDCHKAGLTGEDYVEPLLREYVSFDGLKVPYFLYVPPGQEARGLPVMVHIHGGPEGQSMPAGVDVYQYMVQNGIAVAEPNVRGSTGYGKVYTHLDDVEKRLDSVADIEYLVKDLVGSGIADRGRIAVSGGSYGGFMTLSCAARYPDLWCCAVDIVGMFNLETFLENTAEYRRPHRESEYGSLANHREILRKVSPVDKVDCIKGPMMIIHGQNDPRVPVSEAYQAAEYLKGRGVDIELLVYPDEGHGLVKMKNKLDCYPRMMEFIKKHMKI